MGFIRVRLGSLRRAKGSSSSFDFAWVYSGTPKRFVNQSGSRAVTRARLGVAVIIWDRFGLVGHTYVFSDLCGFTWVHTGALRSRRVQWCARGLTLERVWVTGFIRVRLG